MSAAKKQKASAAKRSLVTVLVGRLLGLVRHARGSWLLATVLLAAAGGGLYALWQYVGPHVQNDPQYLLSADRIEITPPPPWVRADVKGEVLRDASLELPLAIFDEPDAPPLTQRLAEAFALHPWVAKVQRVSKLHPARVHVELVYREPVCMVEVPGGLYPVDIESVVLPTGDFLLNKHSRLEALRYPRVAQIGSLPVGPAGTRWGDPWVAGAARLAAVLRQDWEALGLARIVPATNAADEGSPANLAFDLHTTLGRTVRWGRPPGEEPAGEPPAEEKLDRLRRYAARYGSLDQPPEVQVLDLRSPRDLVVRPSTSVPR